MLSPLKQMLTAPFWVGLITLLLVVACRIRFRAMENGLLRARVAVRAFLSSSLVVAFLVCGGVVMSGIALYMNYVAPWDIMQDVVSAQQLLRGESAYPADMKALMRASLQAEPPRLSLGKWIPQLKQKEQWETGGFLDRQAHPPHLVFLALPFVALFGVHAAVLSIDILSLAALCLILFLAQRELKVALPTRLKVAFFFVFFGWWPVVNLLRQGQSGLLVAAPLVVAWVCLRRGEQAVAGIAVAIGTCLKLYPGLLLVYLMLRYRRALAAATASLLALGALPLIWTPRWIYAEYFRVAGTVVRWYGGHPLNISLLGVLRKSGLALDTPLFVALAVGIVGGVTWLVLRTPWPAVGTTFDFEYATFMILMLLLSPIAWDHYLVILILPIILLGERVWNHGKSLRDLGAFIMLVVTFSIPVDVLVGPFLVRGKPWVVNPLTGCIHTLAVITLAIWMTRLGGAAEECRQAAAQDHGHTEGRGAA